jgi:hypothetical protein
VRCAYCHDELGEARQTCGACGSHVHPDCGATLGGCATLGCARAIAPKDASKPAAPHVDGVSPAERRARLVLAGFLCLLVVGFCCIPVLNFGSPQEWAAGEARVACEPAVAEAARRLVREKFPSGGPADVGFRPRRENLPPELRRLKGEVYVTPTTLSTTSGGGFGTWGVLIALDPAADPPRSYVEHRYHLRKAGPGIWSWVSPG